MKILVTLDGSPFAENALPIAERIAAEAGSEVHLLSVIGPEPGPHWHVGWSEQERRNRASARFIPGNLDGERAMSQYLEAMSDRFPAAHVFPAVRVGPYAADQIAAYAQSYDVDLVVMASRSAGRAAGEVIGSVAAAVLRAGVAPVTLVSPTLATAVFAAD